MITSHPWQISRFCFPGAPGCCGTQLSALERRRSVVRPSEEELAGPVPAKEQAQQERPQGGGWDRRVTQLADSRDEPLQDAEGDWMPLLPLLRWVELPVTAEQELELRRAHL